jgi:hypothetical protein
MNFRIRLIFDGEQNEPWLLSINLLTIFLRHVGEHPPDKIQEDPKLLAELPYHYSIRRPEQVWPYPESFRLAVEI